MISCIFVFAPVPLTQELSPLAHAGILARRRQAELNNFAVVSKRVTEVVKDGFEEPVLV